MQRSRGYLCSEATLPSLEDSGPCWTAGGGQGYRRVCPAPSDRLPGQLCPLCCPQGTQKSPWGLAGTGLRVVLLAWRARPGQWLCSSKVKCTASFAQNERAFLLVSTDYGLTRESSLGNGLPPFLLIQRQQRSHRRATSTQALGWAPATLTARKHLKAGLLHSLALHLKKQHTGYTSHPWGCCHQRQ